MPDDATALQAAEAAYMEPRNGVSDRERRQIACRAYHAAMLGAQPAITQIAPRYKHSNLDMNPEIRWKKARLWAGYDDFDPATVKASDCYDPKMASPPHVPGDFGPPPISWGAPGTAEPSGSGSLRPAETPPEPSEDEVKAHVVAGVWLRAIAGCGKMDGGNWNHHSALQSAYADQCPDCGARLIDAIARNISKLRSGVVGERQPSPEPCQHCGGAFHSTPGARCCSASEPSPLSRETVERVARATTKLLRERYAELRTSYLTGSIEDDFIERVVAAFTGSEQENP